MVSFECAVTLALPARYPFTSGSVSCGDAGKPRPVPSVTPARSSVPPSAWAPDPTRIRPDYSLGLIELRAWLVRFTGSWSFVHVSTQMFSVIRSFRFQTEAARRTMDRETGTKERPSLCPQARKRAEV